MKIALTDTQTAALRQAPNDWGPLPDNVATGTLRAHSLVVVRDAPGARTISRGFQWRITLTGMLQIGRKLTPKTEPEMAALKPVVHSMPTGGKTTA